ncbi:helix-turn-helix domain-containing protein [Pseudogemmobacter sonorensis]|uniref:helix-turn-helix domain-containing protein n=1 Tax=Pseudogemmobacter sonorensis TaxID=2989681 RepID=UPI00368582E8
MTATLTGARLRERRLALGLRQAQVAAGAGISASYLNLIEHNRRNVTPEVLERLAHALGVEAGAFSDASPAALVEDLRAAAASLPAAAPGIERPEDFAARFPGWAGLVAGLHGRNVALERAVSALNDRLGHDPHLSAALHELLSALSGVRATSAILAETEDLDPEWRRRFHGNLHQDSERLARGAGALVAYLDRSETAPEEGAAAPQEELEGWLAARGWHLPEIEAELEAELAAEDGPEGKAGATKEVAAAITGAMTGAMTGEGLAAEADPAGRAGPGADAAPDGLQDDVSRAALDSTRDSRPGTAPSVVPHPARDAAPPPPPPRSRSRPRAADATPGTGPGAPPDAPSGMEGGPPAGIDRHGDRRVDRRGDRHAEGPVGGRAGAQALEREISALASGAGRALALAHLAQARADARALPLGPFSAALAEAGPDPALLAARFGVGVLAVMRRIALLPGAEAGLVLCDASGTLLFRKPAPGFTLPRFGAACPLWPLFSALARPGLAVSALVESASAGGGVFRAMAFCESRLPFGFAGPDLRTAGMLLLPLGDPAPGDEALPVGSTCRICPREPCPARRELSILGLSA